MNDSATQPRRGSDDDAPRRLRIAAILGRHESQFFGRVSSAISATAAARSADVVFLSHANVADDPARPLEICLELGVDGIVLVPRESMLPHVVAMIDRLPPIVTRGTPDHPLIDTYATDFSGVGAEVARHFHDTGRTRLALIGNRNEAPGTGRTEGYLTTAARLGIPVRDHRVVFGLPNADHGRLLLHELFAGPSPAPDAVFCYNDYVALGALSALRQLNLSVPEDVAVVGCDNIDESAIVEPPLTTVSLAPDDIGHQLTTILLNRIIHGGRPQQRLAANHALLTRESSDVRISRARSEFDRNGWMVSGLAHDMNNGLAVVRGRLDIMLRDDPDSRPLLAMTAAVDRMAGLINRIDYRPESSAPPVVHLNASLHRTVVALGQQLGARLLYQPATDECWAAIRPALLDNVVHNLILNAKRAGADTIRLWLAPVDPDEVELPTEHRRFVGLHVSDDGPGIPPELRPHIFEPFVTRSSGGTGLGLPMARDLITASGGEMILDRDRPHGGAHFILCLRRATAPGDGNGESTDVADDDRLGPPSAVVVGTSPGHRDLAAALVERGWSITVHDVNSALDHIVAERPASVLLPVDTEPDRAAALESSIRLQSPNTVIFYTAPDRAEIGVADRPEVPAPYPVGSREAELLDQVMRQTITTVD